VTSRDRLKHLTHRWRVRRDARRPSPEDRPPADDQRQALAARAFPYRALTPSAYVASHGDDMPGFTYDSERYTDPELDAWLLEVGRLLREGR
jgi:hypothetical protein